MKIKTAYSQQTEIARIVADIQNQIGNFEATFIQFFASSSISPEKISVAMQNAFPTVPMIGCSTAGEIITGKMLDNSLVAMAFSSQVVSDSKIEIVQDISKENIDKAFRSFGDYYQCPMANLDPSKYIGIVLIDGLCQKEDKINERIGDLTNVMFIGGSAADDMQFQKTYIYANGKTYENATVLALLKCETEFDILKTQSFKIISEPFFPTKVDESKRTIIEINGKPAASEYARLLGVDKENLSDYFFTNPFGLGLEEDIYVRSPRLMNGDELLIQSLVKAGIELVLLESTDIVEDTQRDLNKKLKSFGEISAIINYNCAHRTSELKQKNQTQSYGEIFKDIPTIGFSTYGESYIGHMNQTATILLFK